MATIKTSTVSVIPTDTTKIQIVTVVEYNSTETDKRFGLLGVLYSADRSKAMSMNNGDFQHSQFSMPAGSKATLTFTSKVDRSNAITHLGHNVFFEGFLLQQVAVKQSAVAAI